MRINFVFQGGGVRGLAFLGAVQRLYKDRSDIELVGVGGASVGALVGALIAAQYSPEELIAEVQRKPLHTLIHKDPPMRSILAAFPRVADELLEIAEAFKQKNPVTAYLSNRNKINRILREDLPVMKAVLRDIFQNYGYYNTSEIRKWLKELLGRKKVETIGDLKRLPGSRLEHFRVLTTNIDVGEYTVIEKDDENVIDAIDQSIRIPLFFEPFRVGPDRSYVDGGLLSNFPLWMFDQSDTPTIGFSLENKSQPKAANFFTFFHSLLWAMIAAHDRWRGRPANCYVVPIITGDITAIDFDLDEKEVNFVIQQGELAASSFDWSRVIPVRQPSFREPDAQNVLQDVMINARDILSHHSMNQNPSGWLYNYVSIKYIIDPDGSVKYERRFEIENKEDTPIPMFDSELALNPSPVVSWKSFNLTANDETGSGEAYGVAIIPTYNLPNRKGAVIFFLPALIKGKPRRICLRADSPNNFQETLLRGKPENINEEIRVANPVPSINIELWVHKNLSKGRPPSALEPFKHKTYKIENKSDSNYIKYIWELRHNTPGNFTFDLQFSL